MGVPSLNKMVLRDEVKTIILALLKSLNKPWSTASSFAYKEREGSVVWRAVLFTSEGSGLMT